MIYKGYTSSPLHVLKSNNKWEIVDLKSKYKDTYMQIKNVLDNLQDKGDRYTENLSINKIVSKSRSGSKLITTEFIKVESHRCCTVAYCLQTDNETNGVRYIVYGTRYNEDCDRGVGIVLDYITTEKSLVNCPQGNIAKFL